jgi:mRNA interferase MazF
VINLPATPWAVVRVPFPYVERPVRAHRPALVIALLTPRDPIRLAWMLMITSTENAGWRGDVPITDLGEAGLRHPSLIRTAKMSVIDPREAQVIGRIGPIDQQAVIGWLRSYLAWVMSADPADKP